MKIIKQQDFAKLAEIENKQISVYLKRGKVIADKIVGEGKGRVVTFDIDHPVNKSFLESRMILLGNKKQERDEITGDLSDLLNGEDDLKELQATSDIGSEDESKTKKMSSYELDIELKRAELVLRNQKEKIQDLMLAKARKKLVSTDVVGRAVADVIHRFQATIVQEIDLLIRDTLNSIQVDNELITKTLSRLIDIANEVSERAINESKIAIINSLKGGETGRGYHRPGADAF